ncbi:UDP-N-acetylmuramoyl-tripeptide--D-alanyl-D-alanine ligase [Bacillus sp. FJAT-27245]|uniref:UDP-N-acetylmuramoyl-tripeptide--D-alanyl-D- alanine ligase n=1 Tax=Bacillus sp. FJAT-27245 TaxID=1684144 RepID=UPI0006A7B934|nr:UDP-N-acetylmuramoyl-tripeptide--D-alanyl-D-alanine ligase [Bacillus sp. FJAT-27245]
MIKRTLKIVQEMAMGEGLAKQFGDLLIEGVSIDSRTVKEGNLFVPIVREKDGHNFVYEAIRKGAVASLWDKNHQNPPDDIPLIYVDNTLTALQSLASAYRKQLSIKIIGITGSNGKTTTKDMVNSIASTSYKVHKTKGNLNSQIGLPLTILEILETDEIVVLEMGMSERGQIQRLAKIAEPDIAVITMIGLSHIATLGSREEIANAKSEIIEGLKDGGVLIYNGDEPLLQNIVSQKNKENLRFISFGENDTNDLYPGRFSGESDGLKFTLNNNHTITYTLPLIGKHNIFNAIASIAVAKQLNITEENIEKGLKNINITGMRMEKLKSSRGFTVINDAWNSSPTSVKAAIETFQELSGYRKKILVLGDMLELGELEEEYHKEIGRLVNPNKIDVVFTYGTLASLISSEAEKILGKGRTENFTDKGKLINRINNILLPNDIILIKGSRGTAMDEVVTKIL